MRINRHALRAFREQAGISVTSLAQAVGLEQPTLSNIEAGRKDPSDDTAHAIAGALGISIDALVIPPPTARDALKVLTTVVRSQPELERAS